MCGRTRSWVESGAPRRASTFPQMADHAYLHNRLVALRSLTPVTQPGIGGRGQAGAP
jgi:hypothetical protein